MNTERALAPGDRAQLNQRRPALRSIPGGISRAPRAPFVVLVLAVLTLGLIGLLLLNTALQQGSFALDELETKTATLRDRQTALAEDVAARGAPAALAEQARRLGMVPVEDPQFVQVPKTDHTDGAAP